MRRITITMDTNGAVADDLAVAGTPYIGRGKDAASALGSWVYLHREELGLEIELVTPNGRGLSSTGSR